MSTYPFRILPGEFDGKRVLITGGTKGIGRAIAQRFQLAGAKVAATARSPSTDEQDGVQFIRADLGTAAGRRECHRATDRRLGRSRYIGEQPWR